MKCRELNWKAGCWFNGWIPCGFDHVHDVKIQDWVNPKVLSPEILQLSNCDGWAFLEDWQTFDDFVVAFTQPHVATVVKVHGQDDRRSY